MVQSTILYPVIGMAFLTLFIGLRMLALRIKSVRKEGMSKDYFLLNKGAKPPEYLVKITQHYENLFELPVLFYVVTVIILVLGIVDTVFLTLAWFYFTLRCIHAFIHTTYNNLLHRSIIFLTSTVVLYAMWGRLLVELIM